ncbi:MAG TPA: acid phosphatase [Methylomirabilota bacterium]|nr:acid phosphatase [Methylomirabilota bacterium]
MIGRSDRLARAVAALAIAAVLAAGATGWPATEQPGVDRIETIVVIYLENRSFDHLYGLFPGADGIARATPEQTTQVDHDGRPLPHLPPVWGSDGKPDPRFPQRLPNGPFRIDAAPINRGLEKTGPNPVHAFYQNREQIDGGKNTRFAAVSNFGGWAMGHYDGSALELWRWAREYTLADHFFAAAYGGSLLNHLWLICACTPEFKEAPAAMRAQLDDQGRLKRRPASPGSALDGPLQVFDGPVSPDGYAVNNMQPPFQPSRIPPAPGGSPDHADPAQHPLPPQRAKSIGDTLSAKGVSWAWYAGAWNEALADGRQASQAKRKVIYNSEAEGPIFVAHHQPFNYLARFAPGTPDRARHLKDGADFLEAIAKGTLPAVAFYKPSGRLTQHARYADLVSGDRHAADLLERLRKSPQWSRMVVIVTYDENGGFWDHVPPPSGPGWSDRWGPGTRVPTIIVSPFARRGFVDSTPYDTTSIIKLITRRFGLEPLPGVRAKAGDLTNALAF